MDDFKELIEKKLSEKIGELDFQKLLREVILKVDYPEIYKKYVNMLENQIRKKYSIDALEADTLKKLREEKDAKKHFLLDKTMTRTYLKNGYSILDFDYKIKVLMDGPIDIGIKFGYEKDNIHYGKNGKIIEKLQDNFEKSKEFNLHSMDETFQLSNRFNECFYMTVVEKDEEPRVMETVAKECEFEDKNTGEILNGIEINVPLLEAKEGEIIRVMQSFTMPNSLFTKKYFPESIKYDTPSAYTKIRVQEEIYGNPTKKLLKPTLKRNNTLSPDPIDRGYNLYYYFYEWEFFYDTSSIETYELHVAKG